MLESLFVYKEKSGPQGAPNDSLQYQKLQWAFKGQLTSSFDTNSRMTTSEEQLWLEKNKSFYYVTEFHLGVKISEYLFPFMSTQADS